jgi:hypothetical protein
MGMLDRLFGIPSVADFAQQMIQAFREAGDVTDLRFDAAAKCIVRSDPDAPWTVNLANMYQAYLQTPRSERAEYVRSTARSLLIPTKGLPEEFELARADLRRRLWLRAVFEQMRLNSIVEGGSVTPKAPPFEAIGEHLIATVAYDWPQSVQVLGDEDLSKWGVTFYEVMEVARANLQEAFGLLHTPREKTLTFWAVRHQPVYPAATQMTFRIGAGPAPTPCLRCLS